MRLLGAAVLILGMLATGRANAFEHSPQDIRVMALNMYHEARGEGRLGMLAVGWVVLNRMADTAYPGSVTAVVYQGCQFSWVCDRRSDRPRDMSAWHNALAAAAELLDGATPDPTRGAMWYHAWWVRHPGFGPNVAPLARIGRHIFYGRADRYLPWPNGPRLLFASR